MYRDGNAMHEAEGDVIYLATTLSFDENSAAARRIVGLCGSIKAAGYDPVIISEAHSEGYLTNYEGFRFVGVHNGSHCVSSRCERTKRLIFAGQRTADYVRGCHKPPRAIIVYGGYLPFILRMMAVRRDSGIPIFFDAVEWYTPPRLHYHLWHPYYLINEITLRILTQYLDGSIAISRSFQHYFARKGLRSVSIPPTISLNDLQKLEKRHNSKVVKIVYAGVPARKDLIEVIIEAYDQVRQSGKSIELHIAGLTKDELLKRNPRHRNSLAKISSTVKFHGTLTFRLTVKLIQEADFSIILRRHNRTTQFGFPTKFVESMAVGTPVISNITSDLDQYLVDGVNGFRINGVSKDCVAEALVRSTQTSAREREMMSKNARATVAGAFEPQLYATEIETLLYRGT